MPAGRSLLRAGAVLLGLLLVASLILGAFLDRAATRAVNMWLSSAFPVPASIDKVKVRLLAGKVEGTGLKIANPPGFAHREFLTLRKGEMDIGIASLWKDEIVAESVLTDGLVVRVESRDGRRNAQEIFPAGSRKEPKEEAGKRYRIRRMVLVNTLLSYPVSGGEQVAAVERLEIDEPLGKDRSVLLREVLAQVVSRSVRYGAGQAAERMLAGSLPAVRGGAVRAGKSAGDGTRKALPGSGR